MKNEESQPTPGASGVGVLRTRFYGGDRLRYCIIEYWNCGAHGDEEFCSGCRKRVVDFRYRKRDAVALVENMLAAADA